MKAFQHVLIVGLCLSLLSFVQSVQHGILSQPNQVQGLYIYYQSKPVAETEYLGTVKAGLTWNGSPEELLGKLLKKTKADFPTAQAVIIQPDMSKADAVKFKN